MSEFNTYQEWQKMQDQVKGPGVPKIIGSASLDLPKCVKMETPQDEQDFSNFCAQLIIKARAIWEQEYMKKEENK